MILVDVYVPSMDQSYDFSLDENRTVSHLTEEITRALMNTLKIEEKTEGPAYVLCDAGRGIILSPDLTLSECGTVNGSRLILV